MNIADFNACIVEAYKPSLTPEMASYLVQLAVDELEEPFDSLLASALASSPLLGPDDYHLLMTHFHGEDEIKMTLAENPSIPESVVRMLLNDEPAIAATTMAAQGSLSATTLREAVPEELRTQIDRQMAATILNISEASAPADFGELEPYLDSFGQFFALNPSLPQAMRARLLAEESTAGWLVFSNEQTGFYSDTPVRETETSTPKGKVA